MSPKPDPQQPHRRGLRARLWFACLAGALTTSLASACVIAAIAMAGMALDPLIMMEAIGGACLVGLAVALLAGRWLIRGIAEPLRTLEEGLTRGALTGPSRTEAWGEIGDVARGVRALLEADRALREDEAELRGLRASIERARQAVERWIQTERWEPLTPGSGGLKPLAESLDRGVSRDVVVQDQNLESARLVHAELLRVIDEARVSAEQAEHGYVEVTALLTTVREIARLAGEIQQAVQSPAPAREPEAVSGEPEWRSRAAQALEQLVEVSGESVRRLGDGLIHVREINEQVQLLSNRATLIALNVVVLSGRPETRPSGEGSIGELKQLAREVRSATDRVAALSGEIDRAVESANERMHEVREQVLERLVELPAPPQPAPVSAPSPPLLGHWVDRLREMVQDAARKGERVSESHERVSSAVMRVSHHLEEEVRDVEGLVARLTPMGTTERVQPGVTRTSEAPEPRARTLRLLDAEAPPRRVGPGTGQEGGA